MMEICLGWLTAMLCVQTWVLSRVWSESEVLWRRTLAVNPIDHAAMVSKCRYLHGHNPYLYSYPCPTETKTETIIITIISTITMF